MPARSSYDLVIVGMGSAGMVAAEFAATLPLRTLAVERERVGGDCLWTGCVPSKALLAAGKVAHAMRTADRFGIRAVEPDVDLPAVWARVRAVQAELAATTDSPERFRAEGVELVMGAARLTSPTSVTIEGHGEVRTRFVLLATGSRPAVPPIDGLEEAGYVTSGRLFELTDPPGSVVVIGGGPIAVELAQAFVRLGIAVTVLQDTDRLLEREEPSLTAVLQDVLRAEGVDLRLGVRADRVTVGVDGCKIVHAAGERFAAQEIVVATGRRPVVDGLGLEEIGVALGPQGVLVDGAMRSSVKNVYAAGDLAGGTLFTHSAGFEAARAVRNMAFPGTSKAEFGVPWCTFCDPELAHAGLTEAQALERWDDGVEVLRHELVESDRARAEGHPEGAVVLVTHKGRLVGASVLAPGAGEVIGELALAIEREMDLAELAGVVHVYPTISIAIQQLAAIAAFRKAEKLRFLVRSKA